MTDLGFVISKKEKYRVITANSEIITSDDNNLAPLLKKNINTW